MNMLRSLSENSYDKWRRPPTDANPTWENRNYENLFCSKEKTAYFAEELREVSLPITTAAAAAAAAAAATGVPI